MAWNRNAREIYQRPDNSCQNDLTDAEWAIVEPLILFHARAAWDTLAIPVCAGYLMPFRICWPRAIGGG